MGILLTLLILCLTVLVHEYGHYVAMRRNGIEVVEFTIGFGPTLWSRKLKSGTTFAFKPVLLGGYTKPVQEGPGSMEEAAPWVKFKVAVAGPMANAVAAFVVWLVIGYGFHMTVPILERMTMWAPPVLHPLLVALIGSFGLVIATPPLVGYLIVTKGLGFLNGAAGPVGILQMGSHVAHHAAHVPLSAAIVALLGFFSMINVALGGANLLPLFPLDGGLCVTAIMEKYVSKDAVKQWIYFFRMITGMLFLALVVLLFFGDFFKMAGHHF